MKRSKVSNAKMVATRERNRRIKAEATVRLLKGQLRNQEDAPSGPEPEVTIKHSATRQYGNAASWIFISSDMPLQPLLAHLRRIAGEGKVA